MVLPFISNEPMPEKRREADKAFAHGVALQVEGNLPGAMAEWKKALRLAPRHTPALYNLAVAFGLSGDEKHAAENYEKLLATEPTHRDALFNLANLRKRQNRDIEAEKLYRRLTQMHPDFPAGWVNHAKLYTDQGNLEEAEPLLREALARDPSYVMAHWNLSHLLLRAQRWEEAWAEYEWRLKLPEWIKPPIPVPAWTADMKAKRVLLWGDQGIGDSIQFLRYARLVAQRGVEVYALVPKELKTVAAAVDGVAGALCPDDPLPRIDAQAPLLSLPFRLGLSDPEAATNAPYIKTTGAMPLPKAAGRCSAGLVWAGNRKFRSDAQRSADLSALTVLFEAKNVDWYSLQFGDARKQIDVNGLSNRIVDLSVNLHDFSDTAAALQSLDLIVCVDTSVAHLAAAMGRPAWLMLAPNPDWRWTDDAMAKIWYPTVRTFRRPQGGSWQGVASHIVVALEEMFP